MPLDINILVLNGHQAKDNQRLTTNAFFITYQNQIAMKNDKAKKKIRKTKPFTLVMESNGNIYRVEKGSKSKEQ